MFWNSVLKNIYTSKTAANSIWAFKSAICSSIIRGILQRGSENSMLLKYLTTSEAVEIGAALSHLAWGLAISSVPP